MGAIRKLVCIVWLAASALAATAPANIILITLDTVRADRMGFLGSKRGLTPNLDGLARQSVVFSRAYSQVPLTTPSHAGILTGTYPQFNQVNDFQVPLGEDVPYGPDILHGNGYHTAAFLASIVLDPKSGFAEGFDRGFDTYDAGFHMRRPEEDRYHSTDRRGSEVVAHALAWLNQRPKGPFFIWVHLYDAHHPYDPPQPYKSKYVSTPYDGAVAYVDSVVGKFLAQLRVRGLYDNSVIAVTADHGEGLGDHGEDMHGIFLYDETIHVPLVIKLPSQAGAGKRIDVRVELVDVVPTILQAVGVAVPKEVQGQSLLSLMTSTPTPASAENGGAIPALETFSERPAYAETDYPHRSYGWSSLYALRTGKYLYIKAPRQELYDQTVDPNAGHNLSMSATAVTATLAAQLDAFRLKTATRKEAPKSVMDPEAQEKLAALGYMATDPSVSKSGAKDPDIDPKDKIEVANLTSKANILRRDGHCAEAIPLLEQLIAKDPTIASLYVKLGQCYIMMRDYPKAAIVLRKIVDSHPELTSSRLQLAMALLGSENIAGAIPELEIVVEKEPHWDKAHLMLATAYAQTDRAREAVTECEKVLEFAPNHYSAMLLEGQVLVESKHPEAALPRLEKAAALRPDMPDPHESLADAYAQLGQKTDAARERAAAKRLGANE